MKIVNLKLTQSHLEYLTGCKYPTLRAIASVLKNTFFKGAPGRPCRHGPLAMAGLVLMKMRHNLSGQAVEALTGVDAVTLSRYVHKVLEAVAQLPLSRSKAHGCLLVDSTSVRVRSRSRDSYSGHKHQRCAKVQVIVDEQGMACHVGRSWPGSVHDKTVYEREKVSLAQTFNTLMLADKAYAGVFDEGAALLRPIKKGERLWHEQPEMAQAFNRALSLKRVRVEHLFARLKTFKVLQGLFPYSPALLGPVMRLLALAHNLNREGTALLPTG